jgi:hypothetical protein
MISRSLFHLPLHAKASEKERKWKSYKNAVHYSLSETLRMLLENMPKD